MIDRRGFLGGLVASSLTPGVVRGLSALAPPPVAPRPQEPDAVVFAGLRDHFLIPKDTIYGNTGTLGASPVEVLDAQIDCLRTVERDLPAWQNLHPGGGPMTGYSPRADLRADVGTMLNASPDEIAFVQNATIAMSLLANGLDLRSGDEVLTTDEEHVGGISSWRLRAKRHGIVVRELRLDNALERGPEGVVELFADAITPRTQVLMFSHITSARGTLLPVKQLCALAASRDAISIVDGAQAISQIAVNVKDLGCDVYLASSHKWLLAPKGTGVLCVRQEMQPAIWSTLASTGFDDATAGAFRFEHYGTGNLALAFGLHAAVRFLSGIGIRRVERWDIALNRRLQDGLRKIPAVRVLSHPDARFASALTAFEVSGYSAQELLAALWKERIRGRTWGDPVRTAQRLGNAVRFSAHYYVSPAEIDRVLEVVSDLT